MRPDEIRRWVTARRGAAARERAEVRHAGAGADSVGAALALVALTGRLHGWPVPDDPVTAREDAAMYERWARLRRRLRAS